MPTFVTDDAAILVDTQKGQPVERAVLAEHLLIDVGAMLIRELRAIVEAQHRSYLVLEIPCVFVHSAFDQYTNRLSPER
jgi:hypothetical protein